MRVLELYSGTQSIGKEFRKKGHKVLSVELDSKFLEEPWNLEQWTISVADITVKEIIKRLGGKPDIIWASPMCDTHSQAASKGDHKFKLEPYNYEYKNEKQKKRVSLLAPKSDKAKLHDFLLLKTLHLIQDLKPKYYFIENPIGGMRKSPIMQGVFYRHSIAYCQYAPPEEYGLASKKPTDIWTNHPNPRFKPSCKNGAPCHVAAPRGSKTGTQGKSNSTERAVIPELLCKHIVKLSEECYE